MPYGGSNFFSFIRSDPNTTWNVDEMQNTLNVCRCVLPPHNDSEVSASQPGVVHVLFKAPAQATCTDNRGKCRCLFTGGRYFAFRILTVSVVVHYSSIWEIQHCSVSGVKR